MRTHVFCFLGCCVSLFTGVAFANHTHIQSTNNSKMPGVVILKSTKGDVAFNHERHLNAMKAEGCIPCHHTNTPKAGDIKTRFDERVAHYFCRGCHRDKGVGPTECHQCHKK